MRHKLLAGAAAAVIAVTGILAAVSPADAQYRRYGHRHYGGYGPGAGFVAGALLGGALASPYYYGGGPYYSRPYYGRAYYDRPYYRSYAASPDDSYCFQRFKSYDPASGTYLGYDGYRHPCP